LKVEILKAGIQVFLLFFAPFCLTLSNPDTDLSATPNAICYLLFLPLVAPQGFLEWPTSQFELEDELLNIKMHFSVLCSLMKIVIQMQTTYFSLPGQSL
jgi:hypothetical protein